jgi:hypothetical protein
LSKNYTVDIKTMKRQDIKYGHSKSTSLFHTFQNELKYYMNFSASLSHFYESLSNRIPIDLVIRLKSIRLNDLIEFTDRFGFITHQQLLMEKTNK